MAGPHSPSGYNPCRMRGWPIHLLAVGSLILAACGAQASPTAPGVPPSLAAPSPEISGASTLTPVPPAHIVLWLAPAFDPTSGSPAGRLLAERLAAFEQANPGLAIQVRIKGQSGPGGLLESLTAATEAAPAALPDVISLDAEDLNRAVLKGLLVSLDGLLEAPSEAEWYEYAQQAALIDGAFYGLPFGSHADVLAYRTDSYAGPPLSWADLLVGPPPFLFPAGDPTSAFTIAQYLSLDGPLLDGSGRPTLDPSILGDILEFYASARAAGVLPLSARQHDRASGTWAVLREGRATAAVAPLSVYLDEHDPSVDSAIPLPTRDGYGTCFASTWSWAIVTQDAERQALVGQLLTWLTAPEFLGPWTRALSLLPPRVSALALWPRDADTALASRLVTIAQPAPSAEILATFGPPLQHAVEAVLSAELTPEAAALAAAHAVRTP